MKLIQPCAKYDLIDNNNTKNDNVFQNDKSVLMRYHEMQNRKTTKNHCILQN